MKALTEKQADVLGFVSGFIEEFGGSPSVREIAEEFDISTKAAYERVRAVTKKGYFKSANGRSRGIIPAFNKYGQPVSIRVVVDSAEAIAS